MTSVLILSCENPPVPERESAALAATLTARGVTATVVPWNLTTDFPADRDVVVVRGTWDYTQRLDEFLAVLSAQSATVTNPVDVIGWNSHKGYLIELIGAGLPVVPTVLLRSDDDAVIPADWASQVVVKPAVAAGSVGVGLFSDDPTGALAHLRALQRTGDVLVQPFVAEIADGERSLVRLGSTWSHAIRKVPVAGEFRVQEHFGGDYQLHEASAAEIALAEAALALVPGGPDRLSYARVDLIGPDSAPMITELELIEPDLYLRHVPGSIELLADAILAAAS